MKIGKYTYNEFNKLLENITHSSCSDYYIVIDCETLTASIETYTKGENSPVTFWNRKTQSVCRCAEDATDISIYLEGGYNEEILLNTVNDFLSTRTDGYVVDINDINSVIAKVDALDEMFWSDLNAHAQIKLVDYSVTTESVTVHFNMLGEKYSFDCGFDDDGCFTLITEQDGCSTESFQDLICHPFSDEGGNNMEADLNREFDKHCDKIRFEWELLKLGINQHDFCQHTGITYLVIDEWKDKCQFPKWVWLSLVGIKHS